MDKKMIKIGKCFLLIALFICMGVSAKKKPKNNDMNVEFGMGRNMGVFLKSKAEIVEWAESGFSCSIKDTVSYTINTRDFFILTGSCYSGVSGIAVCLFEKKSKTDSPEEWSLICRRDVFTRRVYCKFDEENEQIVFTSYRGATIMTIPFESLANTLDL